MEPRLFIEIGTFTDAGCLVMKRFQPIHGRLVTYDIIPWHRIPHTALRNEDFDEGFQRRVLDLTGPGIPLQESETIRQADFIFVDAVKDGLMERTLCEMLDTIRFDSSPIVLFDDIKFVEMIRIWRETGTRNSISPRSVTGRVPESSIGVTRHCFPLNRTPDRQ
jgi:hypothetical protein